MKKIKGVKNQDGFTIIEVMIVIAITGLMIVAALQETGGDVAKSSFNTGISSFTQSLQNIIEDVSDGQYSDIPETCTIQPAGSDGYTYEHVGLDPGQQTIAQGENTNCVFLGKYLQFYPTPSGSDVSGDYNVFTVAADRYCLDGATSGTPAPYPSPGNSNGLTLVNNSQCNAPSGYTYNPYLYQLTGIGALFDSTDSTQDLTQFVPVPDNLQIETESFQISPTYNVSYTPTSLSLYTTKPTTGTTLTANSGTGLAPGISSSTGSYMIGFLQNIDQTALTNTGSHNSTSGASQGPVEVTVTPLASQSSESTAGAAIEEKDVFIASQVCIGVSDGSHFADIDIGNNDSGQMTVSSQTFNSSHQLYTESTLCQ